MAADHDVMRGPSQPLNEKGGAGGRRAAAALDAHLGEDPRAVL